MLVPAARKVAMRAVVHSRYGNPEVLQVTKLERPVPLSALLDLPSGAGIVWTLAA
jgi:hypothetical protein